MSKFTIANVSIIEQSSKMPLISLLTPRSTRMSFSCVKRFKGYVETLFNDSRPIFVSDTSSHCVDFCHDFDNFVRFDSSVLQSIINFTCSIISMQNKKSKIQSCQLFQPFKVDDLLNSSTLHQYYFYAYYVVHSFGVDDYYIQ